ncbi:MAG TPA: Ig-like domain-containing protein [Verrucomicrobiae bacterium]
MKRSFTSAARYLVVCLPLLAGLPAVVCVSEAAPTIVSTVPANMATGVSPSAAIVVTFSEAMDPNATSAQFMDVTTTQFLTTFSFAWSSANKVLTCTPTTPLPAGHMIYWMVDGSNPSGTPLGGTPAGMFTVATAAGTGCDPNAPMASFTVSKGWLYAQADAGAPTLDPNSPFCFLACTTLPCPRNATNVNLQAPSGATANMSLSPLPGHLTLTECGFAGPAALDAAYAPGNYVFNIQAVGSNQAVTLNFPASLTQPPAPHLANYLAAQSINPAQPFTLAWDPMSGGSTADWIYVEIYGGAFKTPSVGEAGALNGTATGVIIPAGALQPNQSYSGSVTFYHYLLLTNGASHLALTYRASITEFDLKTSAATSTLILANPVWAGPGHFSFEVNCSTGQSLVAEYCADLASQQWVTLWSTNSPSQRVRFTDPQAATSGHLYYRVRTGP